MLSSTKTMAHDDIICGGTSDIEENQWFDNANRINMGNFNVTTPKLAEKPSVFSYIQSGKIFAQGHGFEGVSVTS